MNERIRVREVRLIDAEGNQVGVVITDEARRMASEAGLDLVEVAPDSRPPVCKIMDYGKYKYEQKKKMHAAGRKVHHSKLKELRLRPKTDEHDYQVRVKQARAFLEAGDKVQVVLVYRGRELVHQEFGARTLQRFVTELSDIARVEHSGRIDAKRTSVLLTRK
ncbi:MAG: Translation initiation factor IF-3 [Planctomycetes bacterium]|nr:Translation initiation factor IF-3 [Planctomycetota bacterium]